MHSKLGDNALLSRLHMDMLKLLQLKVNDCCHSLHVCFYV